MVGVYCRQARLAKALNGWLLYISRATSDGCFFASNLQGSKAVDAHGEVPGRRRVGTRGVKMQEPFPEEKRFIAWGFEILLASD